MPMPTAHIPPDTDLVEALATAVLLLDRDLRVLKANAAALALIETSETRLRDNLLAHALPGADELVHAAQRALLEGRSFAEHGLDLRLGKLTTTLVDCSVTPLWRQHPDPAFVVIEMTNVERRQRIQHEGNLLMQNHVSSALLRGLAHEIKNPLGGIRGAAQLLELELPDVSLREYTQVIIKEADRLQTLVDRLLAPHRRPHIVGDVNIHEVCERVRSLVLAEFPSGLAIRRDYDASIPEFRGDKEQLIQAVLNIVHNAAQALRARIAAGDAEIVLRTRVARQVTLAKVRYGLALDLHIIDNGPGIAPDIRDRIFYPLVSGREGGSGLGLTLAQTFVQQHMGLIECESRPGLTDFRILVPLP